MGREIECEEETRRRGGRRGEEDTLPEKVSGAGAVAVGLGRGCGCGCGLGLTGSRGLGSGWVPSSNGCVVVGRLIFNPSFQIIIMSHTLPLLHNLLFILPKSCQSTSECQLPHATSRPGSGNARCNNRITDESDVTALR